MPLHSEPPNSELPYPPAVSRRDLGFPPVADDAVLMPPFSRRDVGPLGPVAALEAPVPATTEPALVPQLAAPAPLPVAPDPDQALAEEVAGRLESMAGDLRRLGFHALLQPRSEREPIDAVLAAVIAGFLARR
jgi:hypothetical protein